MAAQLPEFDKYRHDYSLWYNDGYNDDGKKAVKIGRKIYECLSEKGLDGFFQDEHLLPGMDILDKFFDVIEDSRCTILLLSPGFVADQWHRYLSRAGFVSLLERYKNDQYKIIPIGINGLKEDEVPKEFVTTKVAFIESDEDINTVVRKIVREIRGQRLSEKVAMKTTLVSVQRLLEDVVSDKMFPVQEEAGSSDDKPTDAIPDKQPTRSVDQNPAMRQRNPTEVQDGASVNPRQRRQQQHQQPLGPPGGDPPEENDPNELPQQPGNQKAGMLEWAGGLLVGMVLFTIGQSIWRLL